MYDYKVFCIVSLLLVAIIIPSPLISEFFKLNINIKLTSKAGVFLKLSPFIFIIPKSLIIIYYFNLFSKLENENHIENHNENGNENENENENEVTYLIENDNELKVDINSEVNHNKNERYIELYDEIIDYFEKIKPYKTSEFNIQALAKALNTNTSYISRAINTRNEKGFKGLLNYYRIEHVKKNFLNNHQKKYTIKHIYTEAGFIHQASFNRIFKELEGMTPNEFIKNLRRKNR